MRLRKTTTGLVAAVLSVCSGGRVTLGGVIEFTDKDEWIAAVGRFTTIDFTGFPDGTFITDQYADLGVLFTDGADVIRFAPNAFPNDEWGLDGNQQIDLLFDTPQAYIAVDFPGFLMIELFSGGELIYTSGLLGIGGVGNFGGLISSELFDAAAIFDPFDDNVAIDDLHFGVPAPGAVWILALVGVYATRRRRCQITRWR